MRDYASTRTNIHLGKGDSPKLSVQLNVLSSGTTYVCIDIECLGHYEHIFVYANEGETEEALLNRVLRGLNPTVKAADRA